jgi:hypothetical protein
VLAASTLPARSRETTASSTTECTILDRGHLALIRTPHTVEAIGSVLEQATIRRLFISRKGDAYFYQLETPRVRCQWSGELLGLSA